MIIILILISSCASDEKKIPTAEVQIAERAFELSNKIKATFLRGDTDGLRALCSENLYNNLSAEVDRYGSYDLEFRMRWVDIDSGIIHLYISWEKKAQNRDEEEETSGLAVFVINEERFIAEDILRENPFLN